MTIKLFVNKENIDIKNKTYTLNKNFNVSNYKFIRKLTFENPHCIIDFDDRNIEQILWKNNKLSVFTTSKLIPVLINANYTSIPFIIEDNIDGKVELIDKLFYISAFVKNHSKTIGFIDDISLKKIGSIQVINEDCYHVKSFMRNTRNIYELRPITNEYFKHLKDMKNIEEMYSGLMNCIEHYRNDSIPYPEVQYLNKKQKCNVLFIYLKELIKNKDLDEIQGVLDIELSEIKTNEDLIESNAETFSEMGQILVSSFNTLNGNMIKDYYDKSLLISNDREYMKKLFQCPSDLNKKIFEYMETNALCISSIEEYQELNDMCLTWNSEVKNDCEEVMKIISKPSLQIKCNMRLNIYNNQKNVI